MLNKIKAVELGLPAGKLEVNQLEFESITIGTNRLINWYVQATELNSIDIKLLVLLYEILIFWNYISEINFYLW